MRIRLFTIALGAWLASGCPTASPPEPQSKPAPVPSKDQPTAPIADLDDSVAGEPGVRPDGSVVSAVAWFEGSLESALALAAKEKKLVFVDVGAYWCPPCHRLDEEVFTVATLGERLGREYVAVHIDAEKGDGPEIVRQYKVQAYPTLLVLESSGIEKGRVVDFLPAEDLDKALTRIAAGTNVLADLEDAARDNPDDIKAQYALGHAYALSAQKDRALEQFALVMLADPRDELGLASQVRYDKAMFLLYKIDDNAVGAIAELKALQAAFPGSKSATSAYRLIGRLQHVLGDDDAALASLDAMLAQDPEDLGLVSSYGWFCFRQAVRPDAGLRVVRAGQEKHPDAAELYYLEAELRHLLDDHKGALAAIIKASALEPEAHYYRRQVQRFEELVGS